MNERFLEDFAVGQVLASRGRLLVGKDELIAFAKQFDPQPFHLDELAARKSIFGGLIASGWYGSCCGPRGTSVLPESLCFL